MLRTPPKSIAHLSYPMHVTNQPLTSHRARVGKRFTWLVKFCTIFWSLGYVIISVHFFPNNQRMYFTKPNYS